jgi:hypothetical protein
MFIKSRVSRGILAFLLAVVICTLAMLTTGLAFLIYASRQSADFSFALMIAGGLIAFVGLGLLPCITSKLYERLSKNSSPELL